VKRKQNINIRICKTNICIRTCCPWYSNDWL